MLEKSATRPLAPFAGLWAYPWDIAQWGIRRTVEKVRSRDYGSERGYGLP